MPIQIYTWKISVWEAFKYFFLYPLLVILHLVVVLQNMNGPVVDVPILWRRSTLSLLSVIAHSFLYGCMVCGSLFYVRQYDLTTEIKKLHEKLKDALDDKKLAEVKAERLTSAASQVLVPYRLDALVDKELYNFAAENYRPGLMQANPRSL